MFSALLCIKTHVSARNGKPAGHPSCHSCCSQTEEGRYGNSFQLQTLMQMVFQIAYLPLKNSTRTSASRPFAKRLCLMQAEAISASPLNCHLFESESLRSSDDFVSQDHNVVLSAGAKELKINTSRLPGTGSRTTSVTHR